MNHEFWMKEAIKEAKLAFEKGEVPIGAVLVTFDTKLSSAHNQRETTKNPLHHAELLALEKAIPKIQDWRFSESTLYVTLEPCPMCLGALLQARVKNLVIGCFDPKRPLAKNNVNTEDYMIFSSVFGIGKIKGNNHVLNIVGPVLENECITLIQDFFKKCRI